MKTETFQNFLKGINRRFSREDSVNPEFFYTLQNARVFSRGDTGKVKRIDGYTKFNTGNSTDYSNVLDIINFKDKFVVFYEDASTSGTYHIDVYSSDGTRDVTKNYTTGSSISNGSLTASDDTIFIAPHNKILYDDAGTWILSDYVSKIPKITNITTVDNSTKATGSLSITGGASKYSGSTAKGSIEIRKNNVPEAGETDKFTIKVDGNETAEIIVEYEDTLNKIRDRVYDALDATTNITNDWNITKSNNDPIVFLEAKQKGSSWNNKTIEFSGSDFNIISGNVNFEGNAGFNRFDSSLIDDINRRLSNAENINTTVVISQPKGGKDALTNLGELVIYFEKLGFIVFTENIVNTDTYSDIGSKINSALISNSTFIDNYNVSSTNDTGSKYDINIEASNGGKKYNSGIKLYFTIGSKRVPYSDIFSATINNIAGGQDSNTVGTLENDKNYWYKVRYRYLDGHLTPTSAAEIINTGKAENVQLTIDAADSDIDGNRPKLEIFRKKEEESFFLIDTVDPNADSYVYTDSGESRIDSLDDKNITWSKSHQAHGIVDNRYVRANVEYFDEDYSDPDFTVTAESTTEKEQIPSSSVARVFVKPIYENGTKGFHKLAGTANVTSYGKKLKVVQNAQLNATDRTIDRIGIYANYLPISQEFTKRFNSPELTNQNIATIEDNNKYPLKTRLFFGFKYILVDSSKNYSIINVEGWDSSDADLPSMRIRDINDGSVSSDPKMPQELTANIFGIDYKYVRKYVQEHPLESGEFIGLYRLDMFSALEDAVKTGQLKVRFSSSVPLPAVSFDHRIFGEILSQSQSGEQELSDVVTNEDLLDVEARVVNIVDYSKEGKEPSVVNFLHIEEDPNTSFGEIDILSGPFDSRIYLELENSPFDNIDNPNVTNYSLRKSHGASSEIEEIESVSNTIPWEIVNFEEETSASFNSYSGAGNSYDGGQPIEEADVKLYRYSWDYSVWNLLNRTDLNDKERLVYLGSKNNVATTKNLDITGFFNKGTDNLEYVYLSKYNIYETLIEESDININKTEFANQIIWSENLINAARFSGGRNLDIENFLSIEAENGEIIKIIENLGKLYVFCEKGVAVVNIGEVLTQQKSGEVYVASENFLADYSWLVTSLNDIKRNSIVRIKNRIYFTDGTDVYELGDGFKNITQGIIDLNESNSYYAGINISEDEYWLSDITNGQTWVYNYVFGQWYGPFTFANNAIDFYQRKTVGSIGTDLVEHNTGNDFNGSSFTTLIESAANDTDKSFFDKNYRKFYIQVNNGTGGTFSYGKDYNSLVSKSLGTMKERNGYKHQGVAPDEANSKVIYWEISTQTDGFELADISWKYSIKRRR